MAIQWDAQLSTGIGEIDIQHKDIIKRLNDILAISENEIREKEIDIIVRFFGGQLIDHFNTEEEYMIKHNYPDYDAHKEQHMKFLHNFATLKRMFEKEKTNTLILVVIKNEYVDWLMKHKKNEDKKLADFLRGTA